MLRMYLIGLFVTACVVGAVVSDRWKWHSRLFCVVAVIATLAGWMVYLESQAPDSDFDIVFMIAVFAWTTVSGVVVAVGLWLGHWFRMMRRQMIRGADIARGEREA